MRLALPLILSLVALAPAVASARPFSPTPDDRPWSRGTLMPSLGLGGSFNRGGGGSLLIGAGLTYFAVNNLGLGLNLRNVTTFLPASFETDFPGLKKSIPTNEFSMLPGVMLVLYRNYRFSPYIHGGVGPVFLNHHRGVVGEWNAGPGVLIGLGSRLALNLGISFSSRFPTDKCEAAYRYQGQDVFYNPCGLRWNINVGLVFGFGVGRKRNNPQPPPPGPTYVPPPDPAPEPYPAPIPPPASEPAVAPVPTAEPTTAEPLAPTTTTPPPGESVPAAPPPGESVPVAPLPDE